MFDGEEEIIDTILENYEDFLKVFEQDPTKLYSER